MYIWMWNLQSDMQQGTWLSIFEKNESELGCHEVVLNLTVIFLFYFGNRVITRSSWHNKDLVEG